MLDDLLSDLKSGHKVIVVVVLLIVVGGCLIHSNYSESNLKLIQSQNEAKKLELQLAMYKSK